MAGYINKIINNAINQYNLRTVPNAPVFTF